MCVDVDFHGNTMFGVWRLVFGVWCLVFCFARLVFGFVSLYLESVVNKETPNSKHQTYQPFLTGGAITDPHLPQVRLCSSE